MMNIILIRHGEADGNVKGILMGCKKGSFLTERGVEQSHELGRYLKDTFKINKILSSPVERAKQTSLIVNKYINTEIEYFEALGEIDWGDMTGLRISDIPENISERFKQSPFLHRHPNGESMKDLFIRVGDFCKETVSKYHAETVLIASHDNVLKGIIAYMENLGEKALKLKIDNASITIYHFDGEKYFCSIFNRKIIYHDKL